MKKSLFILIIIFYGISLSGQESEYREFQSKSQFQKVGGWVFTIGGIGMVSVGLFNLFDSEGGIWGGYDQGKEYVIIGLSGIAVGIIFFVAAKKNKEKANKINVSLKIKSEAIDTYNTLQGTKYYFPALSIGLNLN